MHNFIFGFVGEGPEDRRESLRLIRDLRALDDWLITFTFRLYQPAPHVPMGDEAIDALRTFPTNLDELLAYRGDYGRRDERTMSWLDADSERSIKRLTEYYLPMVTSKHRFDSRVHTSVYRALRRFATWRLEHQRFGSNWDERLFKRVFEGRRLDRTYVH